MVKLVRDDEGAWKSATKGQRAVGLVVGLALGAVLVLPVVLVVLFLIGRL
jgi:hypothetical protein